MQRRRTPLPHVCALYVCFADLVVEHHVAWRERLLLHVAHDGDVVDVLEETGSVVAEHADLAAAVHERAVQKHAHGEVVVATAATARRRSGSSGLPARHAAHANGAVVRRLRIIGRRLLILILVVLDGVIHGLKDEHST